MARMRSSAFWAVFAAWLGASTLADSSQGISTTEPKQTEELLERMDHLKLAFGIQPPPLLGLERQARQVQVGRPKTPPPRDPSPKDIQSLPPVSQSSVTSLERVSSEELAKATAEAGPLDAGFGRWHKEGENLTSYWCMMLGQVILSVKARGEGGMSLLLSETVAIDFATGLPAPKKQLPSAAASNTITLAAEIGIHNLNHAVP